MPMRFRKTYKILPGVKVNVSKHGISTSVGPRGMHLTFSKFGVRQSVGLPGTGISETSYIIGGNKSKVEKGSEDDPAEKHHSIHHGEGRGCEIPGIGCLLIVLLIAGVLIYLNAASLTQFWHNLFL